MKTLFLAALAASSLGAAADETSWTDKISVNGDLRFRHEWVSKTKATDTAEQHKEKLRLRLNLNGKVNEKITAKVRIATADGGTAISNNTTMTDNASKKGIFLDIAAIDWKMCESGNAVVGKQENPLRLLPKSELIYDADYTPEGLSISGGKNLVTRLGGFVVQERAQQTDGTSEPDSWLMAGVVAYKMDLSETMGLTFGLGYHNFTAIKKNAAIGAGFLGNSNTGARYDHDFQIAEGLLELRMKMGGSMSLSLYSDYINNFTADENNTGLVAGTLLQTLDDQSKPVWTFGYAYQTTGKDATLSAANNSDLNNGIDGGFAHVLSVGRSVAANTNVAATWYHGQVDNSGTPFWIDRAQADVIVNF